MHYIKKALGIVLFVLLSSIVFSNTALASGVARVSVGAAAALEGETDSSDEYIGEIVGGDAAKKRKEALKVVADITGTISSDEIEEVEEDKAIAMVNGDIEVDGTFAGYTNLGLAKVDNWLNVRTEPSEDSKIVGKMPKNAGCEILEEKDGWASIKSGKVKGWAKLEFLYTGDEAIAEGQKCIKYYATVQTTTLYVREQPTTDSSVITMVPMEEMLEVTEQLDGWVKISIDDEEGYISTDYADISKQLEKAVTIQELRYGMGVSQLRVDMVNYAKQFLGNRYVWGGTSLTNGTDCSGYTMGIYRKFGISLPRVSRAQATVGTKVSVADLRPGDLVFYGKGSYINHVAMYIGGGQVIHASGRKTGIKISNATYRTPITCRRIISD